MRDVCRILAMLRQGITPRPPLLAFALLVDEDGSHTMRVGATDDAVRWPFQPGDRILRVAGDGEEISSLSDLMSALRACDRVTPLVVERAGREVTVPVHPRLCLSVTERRGIRIDGALIAPFEIEDASSLLDVPGLRVQSVEPGSRAEALDLEPGDFVLSVDGRPVRDLDSLVALVLPRPRPTPLSVVLTRESARSHRIFDSHVRELPGADVHLVGPSDGDALTPPR
jgi:S1-C subfamily serine protease